MADTRTYTEIWKRYGELRRSYNFLLEAAYDDGATIAQYAGPERLSRLVKDIDKLLDSCSLLANEYDRRKAQAAVIALLYSAESELANACLFACDNAADFDDYVSVPPVPAIN